MLRTRWSRRRSVVCVPFTRLKSPGASLLERPETTGRGGVAQADSSLKGCFYDCQASTADLSRSLNSRRAR
jgi:hypothetical protein